MALTFTIVTHAIGRGKFEAYHGADLLCTSTEPLCEASRVLLLRGYASPRDLIELWHEGDASWSLRSQVGKAARLTVEEHPEQGPLFVRSDFNASRSTVDKRKQAPRYTPSFA